MQYLQLENIRPGMIMARALVGEDGRLLVNAGSQISEAILKRMTNMGFSGVYVDTARFDDIVVYDVIPDELRAAAFDALYKEDIRQSVKLAKELAKTIKYKETLELDLLDIKNSNNYLYKHCVSVAVFSIVLGVGCGLNDEQLNNLAVAGLLHDIGKLELKKKVLTTKHIYNDKDMDEMKKHPMNSYNVLQPYPEISSVSRNAILFHHENLDGSGYYNIAGEKLGLYPRILRVADTYDALTANRNHRKANSPAEAIEYIMSNVGTIFDKEVVDVFVKKFPFYPVGFTLKLSNGEIGVVKSNSYSSMRPIVRKSDGTEVNLAMDSGYRSTMIEGML